MNSTEVPVYTYPSIAGEFVDFYMTSSTVPLGFDRSGLHVKFKWTYGKM